MNEIIGPLELRDDYTAVVISYSTGIDSTGALAKALDLARTLPKTTRKFLLYCDTGMEYSINISLFYQVAKAFNLIPVLLQNEKTFMDILLERQRWPDMKNRWCTSYLKTGVTEKWIRANRPTLGERVLFVTGERRDESKRRAKYPELDWHNTTLKTERKGRFICHWHRPVLDYEKGKMFEYGKALGIAPHPCYEYVSRCSCMFCVFMMDKHTIENMKKHPQEAKKWLQAELKISHTWKSKTSLNKLWTENCEEAPRDIIV
ncbi:MAG: phosphoadenosine phosphosulfate reductase family protein [Desulfosporosinus sp.]|nr:phosphoadenosine phosphosulfate reductase family protein [Desulfosporosinus sp.]